MTDELQCDLIVARMANIPLTRGCACTRLAWNGATSILGSHIMLLLIDSYTRYTWYMILSLYNIQTFEHKNGRLKFFCRYHETTHLLC